MNEFYISQLAPHQRGPEREFYKDKKRREIALDKIFAQREKDKKKRVLKFTSNSRLILIYLSRRRPVRKFRLWKKRKFMPVYEKFYKDYKIKWRLTQLRHIWQDNELWHYFNEGTLFFVIILFFSQWIFLYDSESVVALCLISFITIFYWNFKDMIEELLHEKGNLLHEEITHLYKGTRIFVKKMEFFWIVYLDLEDNIHLFRQFIKQEIEVIIEQWKNTRAKYLNVLIYNKLIQSYLKKVQYKRDFYYIIRKNLLNKLFITEQISGLKSSIFINKLNNLTVAPKVEYLILNKLGLKTNFFDSKYSYSTYLYLQTLLK